MQREDQNVCNKASSTHLQEDGSKTGSGEETGLGSGLTSKGRRRGGSTAVAASTTSGLRTTRATRATSSLVTTSAARTARGLVATSTTGASGLGARAAGGSGSRSRRARAASTGLSLVTTGARLGLVAARSRLGARATVATVATVTAGTNGAGSDGLSGDSLAISRLGGVDGGKRTL